MQKILEILSQRRIWASIFGFLAIYLALNGIYVDVNYSSLIDNILKIVEGVSGVLAALLPLWSYFRPKKQPVDRVTPDQPVADIQTPSDIKE